MPEVPAFDVLANQRHPYEGLGRPLADSSERTQDLAELVNQALYRLEEGFGIDGSELASVPAQIDRAIQNMWLDNWTPDASFTLFSTDFGLALCGVFHAELGGKPIFRSDTELDHMSLWWKENEIEAFPFHHIVKTLLTPQENSASSFFSDVVSLISTRH